MKRFRKGIHNFLALVLLFGMILLSNQSPILANGNTTNNDISMDCSQCIVKVGEEKSISATITPANDTSLKWRVSDSSIVKLVNRKGGTIKVIGLKEGTAGITAYHGNGSNIGNGNKSVTCTITVASGRNPQPTEPPVTPPKNDAELAAEMKAKSNEIKLGENGIINITLKPKGTVENNKRKPSDVVFVIDQSSSLSETENEQVKTAVLEAVKNLGKGDRLGFITFNENVIRTMDLNEDFAKFVLPSAQLEESANYTDALEKAKSMLNSDSNRNQYIVFLSGGKPVKTVKQEYVKKGSGTENNGFTEEEKDIHYLLDGYKGEKFFFENNKKINFVNISYDDVFSNIKYQLKDQAAELNKQNIKIYAVGFGTDNDTNNLLSVLASNTGGKSVQATTGTNLTAQLRSITSEMASYAKFTDIKFKLKVKNSPSLGVLDKNIKITETPDLTISGDYAVLQLGDIDDSSREYIYDLPIQFTKEGRYTFEDAVLEYKDSMGTAKTYVLPKDNPVTINVRGVSEPNITGTMSFPQKVDNLIISEDQEFAGMDKFTINYKLEPSITNTGDLTNVKLVQKLPDGITVMPGDGILVSADGTVVTVNFAPGQLQAELQAKANWALNTQLENPTVSYELKNGPEKKITIQAPLDFVQAKVILLDLIGNDEYIYQGDEWGRISKIKQSDGSEVASASLTSDPIKKLTYLEDLDEINTNVIRVESRNVKNQTDYVDYLPLVPSIEFKTVESGHVVDDDVKVSKEDILATIDEQIYEPESFDSKNKVVYQYRITRDGVDGEWISLAKWSDEIPKLTGDNTRPIHYKLEVRGQGGFANGKAVVREITIDKTIPNRPPTAGEIPSQTLFVGGERKTVEISEIFDDPDGDQLSVTARILGDSSANQIVKVEMVNNQPVLTPGTMPGELEIELTANDGRGGKVSTTFTVTVIKAEVAPEFKLSFKKFVGPFAVVTVQSVPGTVKENTEWYLQNPVDGSWKLFYTGVMPSNMMDIAVVMLKDDEGNPVTTKVQVQAKTGTIESIKEITVQPDHSSPADSFRKEYVTFTLTSTTLSATSGNRAAKVIIKYKINQKSSSSEQDQNSAVAVRVKDAYYTITDKEKNLLVMKGTLPSVKEAYVDSTPVIKFLKSPSGKTQTYDVNAAIEVEVMSLTDKTMVESFWIPTEKPLAVVVKANEKLK
ncbi:vWA domain-containing protein [Ammoniphilus resinae]|uniref:Mg-chelatase subunit ChlD/soluble P-type ATPase n=1 Tax=Ammoniphilus resinae TaxID=861532 RepID=A0ABS4GIZ0_9BACL|nr:VWA domain-containing protein [Ammoniphilus resinae]MBP1930216.1 Mg-chelatase subunit ChlD/soluble P-type ATPase [Ammoniphilus resinae]